ncbi:hypothetical protein BD779DRAFT_1410403, partial [Infundibulicybe gibba]
YLLDKVLQESGKSLKDFPPMPHPLRNWAIIAENPLIAEHLNYNPHDERDQALQRSSQFNHDQ